MGGLNGLASPIGPALPTGPEATGDPRLKPAAHEFEACLMKEFLTPLQHDALFADEGNGDSDNDEGSGGALMSFGSETLAKAISDRGGFGIADKIIGTLATGNRARGAAAAKI